MRVFEGKVMGVPKKSEEELLEEAQMKKDVLGGRSAALQPLDFNNKIMGGSQMTKTEEQLPSLGGAGDYQERLGSLLGHGGKGKKAKDIPSEILGGFNGGDKANSLLGGNFGSFNPKAKAESMLGLGATPQGKKSKNEKSADKITESILGGFGGGNPSKNAFDNVSRVFGKPSPKSPVQKINSMFAPQQKATSNPFKNGYNTPVNV